MQLIKNATHRPHIDSGGVRVAKDYLWRPIESRLNIFGFSCFVVKGASEINDFDPLVEDLLEHYVIGLKISVNHIDVGQGEFGQPCQKLPRKSLYNI